MTPSTLKFGPGFADRDERTRAEKLKDLDRVVKETLARLDPMDEPEGECEAGVAHWDAPLNRRQKVSYSFSVQGATKAEAKEKVAKEWDNIVSQQPIHKADRDSGQAAAEAAVDNLSDPDDTQQISVSSYGSVSYRASDNGITSIGLTVNASLASKA